MFEDLTPAGQLFSRLDYVPEGAEIAHDGLKDLLLKDKNAWALCQGMLLVHPLAVSPQVFFAHLRYSPVLFSPIG
jgi:hypothetical protein